MALDFNIRMFDSGYGEDKEQGLYYCRSFLDSVIDKRCPLSMQIDRFSLLGEDTFFSQYFSGSEEFKNVRDVLNERNSPVSQTGISSRVLNHWFTKKILPEGVSPVGGDWKKFTPIEVVWIRAINHMRTFGLSLKQIAKVRYWVLQWDKKSDAYPWFEYYVALAKVSEKDPYVVILSDGTAELATSSDIEMLKARHQDFNKYLLFISLKSVLRETGFEVGKTEVLEPLTEAERKVRSALLEGNKEINMLIRKGEVVEIGTVQNISKDTKISEVGREIEKEGVFGDVLAKYSQGKLQSVNIHRKRRLEK